MKKTMLVFVILAIAILSGCAVQRHCFINPPPNRQTTRTTGSPLVEKTECYGKVSVNECSGFGLTYLGKVGDKIRIQGKVGSVTNVTTIRNTEGVEGVVEKITVPQKSVWSTPVITEIVYPENSKFIQFQDVKIEVIEASDNQITFKLINISTQGCTKVNGQEVK